MGKLLDKVPKVHAELSSASMADIAFLLIVFFMVTAVFSATKGLDFKLPADDDNQTQTAEEEQAIYFKVLESGLVLMDGRPTSTNPVEFRQQVTEYVVPKLTNWPEKPIIIYSLPEAPYQGMVGVYDSLTALYKKVADDSPAPPLTEAPNISIPTQSEVNQYIALFGYNPFDQQ